MEVIKAEKEILDEVWKKYKESGSPECRDQLIVQYLFLVKYVVGKLGSVLPGYVKLDDLYSSGVTGLIRAVERFDPSRNIKFESYAILLVKGAIIDELRELDWIPRSVHQKAHLIADAQERLQQKLGREPSDDELAADLGMKRGELEELLERVRPAVLIPLNGFVFQDEEKASLLEKIADTKAETSFIVADRNEYASLLSKAISELPEQEKKVLMLYYYEEMVLKEIGKVLGVSESRVSQIHTKAILKLRSRLQSVVKD